MIVVSIIMVTYNAEEHLPDTLESVRLTVDALPRNNREHIEFVVVDGCSIDRTVEVITDSGLADLIVSEPDRGIYDAMNKGAVLANGRWLHFLNAGDVIRDPAAYCELVRQLAAIHDEEKWVISGAVHLGFGSHDSRIIGNLPHSRLRHLFGLQPHCHQACWFRRDVFEALDGYSLSFSTAADYATVVQFGLLRAPAVFDRLLIGYLGGGVSDRSQRDIQRLLHHVRSSLFGLRGAPQLLSAYISAAVATWNSFKIAVGRSRSVFKGTSPRPIANEPTERPR